MQVRVEGKLRSGEVFTRVVQVPEDANLGLGDSFLFGPEKERMQIVATRAAFTPDEAAEFWELEPYDIPHE